MEPNNFYNLRVDVFRKSSDRVKYLYGDLENLIRSSDTASKFSIIDQEKFETTVGDIVLGFYKIEDTVPLLQQELGLDPKTAALLGAEVLEFLTPLSDPTWQPPVEESEDTVLKGEDIPPAAQEVAVSRIPVKAPAYYSESIPTPPQAPAAAVTAIPVYTPTAPVNTAPVYTPNYEPHPTPPTTHEPVYQSTQPSSVRPPLSNIPSYTPPATPPAPVPPAPAPDRPRWSTDI
jgi:hypothetical protein